MNTINQEILNKIRRKLPANRVSVCGHVLLLGSIKSKILYSIIRRVAIYMVNFLLLFKKSSQVIFHNKSVLHNISLFGTHFMFWFIYEFVATFVYCKTWSCFKSVPLKRCFLTKYPTPLRPFRIFCHTLSGTIFSLAPVVVSSSRTKFLFTNFTCYDEHIKEYYITKCLI